MAAEKTKTDKVYEVAMPIVVGKGERRGPGCAKKEVRESELGKTPDEAAETRDRFLKSGHLIDPEKPIAPSAASSQLAFDHLVDVAEQAGILKRSGADYDLAGQKFAGIAEFRASVSVDSLKEKIVERLKK